MLLQVSNRTPSILLSLNFVSRNDDPCTFAIERSQPLKVQSTNVHFVKSPSLKVQPRNVQFSYSPASRRLVVKSLFSNDSFSKYDCAMCALIFWQDTSNHAEPTREHYCIWFNFFLIIFCSAEDFESDNAF